VIAVAFSNAAFSSIFKFKACFEISGGRETHLLSNKYCPHRWRAAVVVIHVESDPLAHKIEFARRFSGQEFIDPKLLEYLIQCFAMLPHAPIRGEHLVIEFICRVAFEHRTAGLEKQ